MNLVQAIRFYIKKMTDEIGSGVKIFLLDQDTVLIKFLLFLISIILIRLSLNFL